MGKRFGRNQKRKLVQMLAGMNAAVNRRDTDICMLKNRISGCEDTIRLTALVLGTHFCTLPPEVVKAHGLDRSPVYQMVKPTRFNPLSTSEMMQSTFMALRQLDIYRAELRTNELSDQVHVRIQGPRDEGYGYAISSEMKRMYPRDMLIELISRELAMLMVREWTR